MYHYEYTAEQQQCHSIMILGVLIRHIPERIIGCPNSPHSCTYHWVSQFATFLYVSLGVIIHHIPVYIIDSCTHHWVSQFATFLYVSLGVSIRQIPVRIIGCHNSPHSCTYHWFLYVSLGVTIRLIPVRIRLWQYVTRRFKTSLLILTSIHYFFAGNDKNNLKYPSEIFFVRPCFVSL